MRKLTYISMLFVWGYISLFPQYSWAHFESQQEPILTLEINSFDAYVLASANPKQISDNENNSQELTLVQGNSLVSVNNPDRPKSIGPSCPIGQKRLVIVTAYSSTPDQTDDSPFITASGSYVRDGIVAANFLKFGTKVKFPGLYGDKIFIVEDRMATKNNHKVDIWMPSREQALDFGVKKVEMIVL